ncbi:hypothetical protein CAOG_06732 [Capsaspora owczarzaki ATCC 30864]|uniref:CHCH domain-containing protein n=1 Tax=Capsaspora owczarzaki (strain ATCC 30864) TaxID=595528 RepID=A0A0D2WUL1_CAPO3|nr:hypothetical protein CAOG_06732 [Capsaspora owczarzaki ATCC 30864]KJE96400.1 hypothetical protein CAOG_006732 [Capsaspora owczarzaki ATCC 30864]|eukprot:XP_004344353.1 hypothetical protein CAOG_06732 [Capsaspora owczarzaki ATCC 30864]
MGATSSAPRPTRKVTMNRTEASAANPTGISVNITENLLRSLAGERARPTITGRDGRMNRQEIQPLLQRAHAQGVTEGYQRAKGEVEHELRAIRSGKHQEANEQTRLSEEQLANELSQYLARANARFVEPVVSVSPSTTERTPCAQQQAAALKCYRSNPDRPLDCSELVRAFTTCATRYQTQYVSKLAEQTRTTPSL